MERRVWQVAQIIAVTFSMSVFAAQVTKVKGRNVLVQLSGEQAEPGDQFFLINSAGKKKALIQITKVRGSLALAKVGAGKAEVGMTLQRRSSRSRSATQVTRSSETNTLHSKAYWGFLLGGAIDSMSVDLPTTPTQTVSLSGSSFSFDGLADYKLFDRVWFRGLLGYQGFNGTGQSICSPGNVTCTVDISYLDFTFLGRYLFTDSSFRPWLGGGFSLLFPVSKSSTALTSSSIGDSGIFIFTGGFDWSITPNMYIPFSIEYALYPKSSTVDASWFAFRVGLAFPF